MHQSNQPIAINLSSIKIKKDSDSYKWYVLTLAILSNMLVAAIPTMGISVLSKEISTSLQLSVTQVGVVWGISTLPGIVTALYGGALGDRFGPKNILILTSLLGGLFGAARGLANNYEALLVMVLLVGIVVPVLTMNTIKVAGQWFPPHQLGIANGMISMGMALGFFLGSLLSATTFSPLLGGWRNVLITYGLIGATFSVPWYFTKSKINTDSSSNETASIRSVVSHVAHQKDVWILGISLLGIGGCIQGILGYIPLYLRNSGWEPIYADGALSAFHTISLVFVLPVSFWAARIGKQKKFLIIAGFFIIIGAALLSFAEGPLIWFAVLLTGCVRDAFMAIFLTLVISIKNIGPTFAGTATGLAMAISVIGNTLAPPLGNSLAEVWSGAPFLVWCGFAILGVCCLSMIKQPQKETA